jgi:lantibiotic modifying enzyme
MRHTTSHRQPTTADSLFLTAAIEIGDLLIEQAVIDDRLIYWKVVNRIEKTISYDRDDLYSGGSGIGLFFLELYKHTRRKKYVQIGRRAIRSAALREKSKPLYPSFIGGRIGVAYALIKLYELTGTQRYRTQALTFVKSCRGAYSTTHEYLGGNAGVILCLLHIYTICKESWLLEMADEYARHILQGIHHGATGIYWDSNPFQIRPLCGFSHGVAGIGFVFLELGQYLNNSALYSIAEQAFAYENAYFDRSRKNWPDFRLSMWKPEQIANMESAYTKGDPRIFSKAGNMAAWCHGAPGIALSRILAYQLIGNQTYLDDIDHAVDTTRHTPGHDISLCHGLAGNLDTFIESYLALGRDEDWRQAHAFGEQLLRHWKRIPLALQKDKTADELLDPSLFLGLAGVGYTFLRLHDPHVTPSILAPRLAAPLTETLDTKLSTLRIDEAGVQAVLSKDTSIGNDSIKQLKHRLIAQYPSRGLLYIKYRLGQESARQLLQLTDDQLTEQVLQLNADCSMLAPSSAETQNILLFRYTPLELEQRTISQFCYILLAAFENPQKVQDVIGVISKRYGFEQSDQRTLLQSKALEQIRQALYSQFLIAGK